MSKKDKHKKGSDPPKGPRSSPGPDSSSRWAPASATEAPRTPRSGGAVPSPATFRARDLPPSLDFSPSEEQGPRTRRSSPPEVGPGADLPLPSLAPVTLDLTYPPPPLGDGDGDRDRDELDEGASDLAPIGPTEFAAQGFAGLGGEGDDAPLTRDLTSSDGLGRFSRAPGPSVEQLEQQIRELEQRLDAAIGQGREAAATPPDVGEGPREGESEAEARAEAPAQATARELLSSDFYLRQWGRAGLRSRSEDVDEFGHDPKYEARYLPLLDFLYKHYFRVETTGTENIPAQGRCVIIANHSGGPLPYDGVMLRTAVRREHEPERLARWLAEDFIYYLPFAGAMMNRLGAVRACQENAERLLAQEQLLVVFPEGAKGIGKLFRDRYKLQRFGRGGFIRLCLRTRTPIVPCALVGAEEANPMLYRLEYMTKALGIPYLPITPTFPALGPLGLLPAPTKWKIAFGEAIHFDEYGPEAADDEILVGRLGERVRSTIQGMLDRAVQGRRSIWFG